MTSYEKHTMKPKFVYYRQFKNTVPNKLVEKHCEEILNKFKNDYETWYIIPIREGDGETRIVRIA